MWDQATELRICAAVGSTWENRNGKGGRAASMHRQGGRSEAVLVYLVPWLADVSSQDRPPSASGRVSRLDSRPLPPDAFGGGNAVVTCCRVNPISSSCPVTAEDYRESLRCLSTILISLSIPVAEEQRPNDSRLGCEPLVTTSLPLRLSLTVSRAATCVL